MSEGLPDLVSHVKLDTTGVTTGVAKTKAELGGLGGATGQLEGQFKSLLSSVTGLGGGTSQLSGVVSKLGGSFGTARSEMAGVAGEGSKLTSVMTGVGVGVAGVGLAIAALAVEGIAKFTAAAGEVRKLQATLGSTAEDASRLRNVAIGLGVDVDTMGKAFFKLGPILEKNQGDLGGVHVEMAKNVDGSTNLVGTLDNMRQAYQSITDPVQRSQFALDAFKKTGLELRPILSSTNEQFKQLANTGPIFKQADLDKAKQLAIAQRELKQSMDEVQIALARGLVPVLTKFSTGATEAIGIAEEVGGAFSRLAGFANDLYGHLGPLGTVLKGALIPGFALVDLLRRLHIVHGDTAGSAEASKEAQDKLTQSLKDEADQAKAAAEAFDKLVTAQEDALDKSLAMDHALLAATRSAEGITAAELQLAQAHQTVAEKQAALTKLQQDGTATAVEIKSATLDLQSAQLAETQSAEGVTDAHNAQRDALIAAAKAVRDKQVADEEATGATISAEQKTRAFVSALRDQASTLAPGSELRRNLEEYANQIINGIPDHKSTEITLPGADGVLGTLDDIRGSIDALHDKTVTIDVVRHDTNQGDYVDNGAGKNLAASGGVLGRRSIIPMASGGRTDGFITNRPTFLVGEGDPNYRETVIASDPRVRPRNLRLLASAANDMGVVLGGGGGGAGTITINPAPVIITLDGREIARATVKFSAEETDKLQRSLR